MRRELVSFSLTIIGSRVSNAFTLSFQERTLLYPSSSRTFTTLVPCLLLPFQFKRNTFNKSSCQIMNMSGTSSSNQENENKILLVDEEYPGTAVKRLRSVHERIATLSEEDLSGDWEDVRRKILWAGGLKDLPDAIPGQGYTGHSFNDYNHVDLTTMNDQVSNNENDGRVKGIAIGNNLGNGIRIASITELGPGGSWSTCAMGCHHDPPQDVAHVQFKSRIAFKLVWVPNEKYDVFVLVDDDGNELARGRPTGQLPMLRERQLNYRIVHGSKYARVALEIASKEIE